MTRPASALIKNFSDNLERCINNSSLPPILVELVMRNYYVQIKLMADRQTAEEEKKYKEEHDRQEVKKDGK